MANLSSQSVTLVELKRTLVPAGWADSVRVVGMSECKEAAVSLAYSFAADDLSQYLLDLDDMELSVEDKWRLHVDIMHYYVAAVCLRGVVTTIGPDYDAVALWMPPGSHFDWWTTLRSGMWRLHFKLSPEGRKRLFDDLVPRLDTAKSEVLGKRNSQEYYLMYIGTKPSARGKGYARKLLEHMFEKADHELRPIYLESSAEVNDIYYRKFGFQMHRQIHIEDKKTPVKLSIMVREPQPARKVAYNSSGVVKVQTELKV